MVFNILPKDEGADPLGDEPGFSGFILGIEDFDGFSRGRSGPEGLFFTVGVVGDQKVCGT